MYNMYIFLIFPSVSCHCSSLVAMEKVMVRKNIRRLKVLPASGTEITVPPASLYALPPPVTVSILHCCAEGRVA